MGESMTFNEFLDAKDKYESLASTVAYKIVNGLGDRLTDYHEESIYFTTQSVMVRWKRYYGDDEEYICTFPTALLDAGDEAISKYINEQIECRKNAEMQRARKLDEIELRRLESEQYYLQQRIDSIKNKRS